MAGRTLQQAMAYLGLAEQSEPEGTQKREQPPAHDLSEESFDEYLDDRVESYEYHDSREENYSKAEDRYLTEPESLRYSDPEPLAPTPESERSVDTQSIATSRGSSTAHHPYITETESENELRRITTIHPRSYNDAKIIGESFREDIPVIMNVTDMGEPEAKRLVDFSAGLAFALHGSIERVTDKVFLLTPANLEVLGAEGAEVPVTLDNDSSDLFNQGSMS